MKEYDRFEFDSLECKHFRLVSLLEGSGGDKKDIPELHRQVRELEKELRAVKIRAKQISDSITMYSYMILGAYLDKEMLPGIQRECEDIGRELREIKQYKKRMRR